jgi:hypothetical protein
VPAPVKQSNRNRHGSHIVHDDGIVEPSNDTCRRALASATAISTTVRYLPGRTEACGEKRVIIGFLARAKTPFRAAIMEQPRDIDRHFAKLDRKRIVAMVVTLSPLGRRLPSITICSQR